MLVKCVPVAPRLRVPTLLLPLAGLLLAARAHAQAPAEPVPGASSPSMPTSTATPLAPETAPPFTTTAPPTPAQPAPVTATPASSPAAQPPPPTPPIVTPPADGMWVRRRAPRSIGVWLGWGWNAVNYLPMRPDGAAVKPHGASLVVDYGWQVGGLRPGGWPTYIGFILGSTFYPGASDRRNALTLEYGLLVRHHLAPQWKVHPFLAYGLGAIQAFVFGVEGRGIGHLTRLSVGIEGKVAPKVRLALELIYKLDPIRAYRVDESMPKPKFDIHTVSAMFGVNFSL